MAQSIKESDLTQGQIGTKTETYRQTQQSERTLSTKWDFSLKSLFSELREPQERGSKKHVTDRMDGGR